MIEQRRQSHHDEGMRTVVVRLLLCSQLLIVIGATAMAQSTFSCMPGALQTFTAPQAGIYQIVVNGAQGGNSNSGAIPGGSGAQVGGDILLSSSQALTIAVGCQGVTSAIGAGGGGGSFVVAASTPLFIAGGGGGAGPKETGGGGQAANNGANGSNPGGGAGGVNGNGGGGGISANNNGGGGGGFLSGGTNGMGSASGSGGQAYPNLTGGSGFVANGGFGGGGGGGLSGGGGGGGYSGGGGGGFGGDFGPGGGGGGSLISPAAFNISATGGTTSGDGSVVITLLTPLAAPAFTKAFGASTIMLGASTSLTFSITNSNSISLSGLAFTDMLPSGLVVSNPTGLNGMCGGAVTAAPGGNTISLSGGTLAANSSCTITLNVTSTMIGALTNVTGPVSASIVGVGGTATATLNVTTASLDIQFQSKIFPNISAGDSLINIGNTGASATLAQAFAVVGAPFLTGGNLCVNAYVFSPDEQEVACCSCYVTPNGVVTTSVRQLISKTLTPAVPTAVTVKLLATDGSGGSASCNPSAPLATMPGLIAFGTNLYSAIVGGSNTAGTFAVTETPFIPATLSAAELSRISTLCGFIQSNGTGFGVCPGCATGAAGASRY